MCAAAHSRNPTPDGSGDGLASARCAAPPSLPRGIDRWRERRGLLASGGRLTFPGKATQWRRAVKNARYSGGGAPGLRTGEDTAELPSQTKILFRLFLLKKKKKKTK